MQTIEQVMAALEAKGSAQTRKTFARHGAPVDSMFGVKVGDIKEIAKKIKGNQELALALYDTGNSDAMYLAGMVADGRQMTKAQLNAWAKGATWRMIADSAVAGVAAESPHACELALKWMDSKKPLIASAGWNTYSLYLSVTPDADLDLAEIKTLVERATCEVHSAPDRVGYAMNNFVICVGTYVAPLLKFAKAAAKKIGKVEIDMGDTACKVPLASEYIAKVESMGRVGTKRKSTKC
ncbi:DNA alkylation repair protein [Aeoliella sp. SH292]|uniref:DNA alkylation repair protein n=1 Tax=Aeoliella sp. SH292 TaxID=3454464 RepID=UPI003F99A291